MADLSFLEKHCIENFFELGGGYVLDFSNRTFQEFIIDTVGKDIYDEKYNSDSGSKANRLRALIKGESNHDVGCLLEKLLEYAYFKLESGDSWSDGKVKNYEQCLKFVERLKSDNIVKDLHAIKPNNNDGDFKLLAKLVKESIEKNEPESGLDRLHTFYFKYIRQLCTLHSIKFTKIEPLNSLFGKYVKFLNENNHFDSTMAEMILRYSTNLIASFNDIRNNKSLAHDNKILNYDESILIFNNIASSIKFIETIEKKITMGVHNSENVTLDDDCHFK